jgi:glycosyltransferase involved in cell wall biosynthesis
MRGCTLDKAGSKDTIKVCHIATRFLGGGGTKYIINTLRMTNRPEFQNTLVVGGSYKAEHIAVAREAGANVVVLKPLVRNVNPLMDLYALLRLALFIQEAKPDVIHTHIAKAGVLGRLAAKLVPHRPYVIHTIHGVSYGQARNPMMRDIFVWLERVCAKVTDLFVSVGEDLVTEYKREGIIARDNLKVIRSYIDWSEVRQRVFDMDRQAFAESIGIKISSQDFVIACIGRVEADKGQRRLIDAISSRFRGPQKIKILIVGDGSEVKPLQERVRELGIERKVLFTGYRKDIWRILSIVDVVVLLSESEGLPHIIIEGLLAGVPYIGTDVCGLREIHSRYGGGTLINGDYRSVGSAIREVQKGTITVSEEVQNSVKREWDPDRIRQTIVDLYRYRELSSTVRDSRMPR